jgi:hypothetical protein
MRRYVSRDLVVTQGRRPRQSHMRYKLSCGRTSPPRSGMARPGGESAMVASHERLGANVLLRCARPAARARRHRASATFGPRHSRPRRCARARQRCRGATAAGLEPHPLGRAPAPRVRRRRLERRALRRPHADPGRDHQAAEPQTIHRILDLLGVETGATPATGPPAQAALPERAAPHPHTTRGHAPRAVPDRPAELRGGSAPTLCALDYANTTQFARHSRRPRRQVMLRPSRSSRQILRHHSKVGSSGEFVGGPDRC